MVEKIFGIEREALIFMLEVSRKSHPYEFAGVLRAKGGLVREVLVLPGTHSSNRSALLRLHMLPIDRSACGTVHSHPSPDPRPSREDLTLFAKFGRVHIIIAYPYDESSWRAYDHRGEGISLEIIG
ncbi:MAG: Mov34/MPN/PAD-1 family protein [Hadesarchaea archaeon]|nr:Mov34/MPN/PAD-1 family protein [Hadesarchaea archaeon]